MTAHYLERHEAFLKHLINNAQVPAAQLHKAIHYSLCSSGKRIRPTLVYLSGMMLHLDLNTLDVIAAAVELTHCYSLIHDDLPAMDDDDLRRGKPSCHKAFDEATAILAGDGMQAFAIEILLQHLPALLTPERVIAVTLELVSASGISGMISGQSLDLSELHKSSLNEMQLREIHHLKTGQLISACIDMVLISSSAPENDAIALRLYAKHLGLVFQMQDDYLDRYAPETLGKAYSSDQANQKTTFATLYSKEQLEKEIKRHYQIALDSLSLFGEQAEPLIALTLKLQNRSDLETP